MNTDETRIFADGYDPSARIAIRADTFRDRGIRDNPCLSVAKMTSFQKFTLKRFKKFGFLFSVFLLLCLPCYAAKIGEISQTNLSEQLIRFFSFQDPSLRFAIYCSILLGIMCGLMGSFIVVRKMALMGDALSHAVLPGVAMGFLWTSTKNPFAILVGATIAGLLGTAMVNLIKQTTRIKEDTAIGMVLASFFSVGICMVTMIQHLPTGNKSGIDKFLFGQIAAISSEDIRLMAIMTVIIVVLVVLFYKEFLLASFDPGFAQASGFSIQLIHYAIMLLLAFAIVLSLQAVGVVLVSAMLITPAAAAYLITDRFKHMLFLAALFGIFSGVLGAFLSFLGNNLPTGPFMVLGSSIIFFMAFLFAPKHGVLVKWLRHLSRSKRVQRENTLKALYHILENRDFVGETVSMEELATKRRETIEEATREVSQLQKYDLASFLKERNSIVFTPGGWERACAIVRNHRLWELYLTNAAQIAPDHVHEDAEKIEHILGDAVVLELERRLQYATKDPHGKSIPSLQDIRAASAAHKQTPSASGYRQRP